MDKSVLQRLQPKGIMSVMIVALAICISTPSKAQSVDDVFIEVEKMPAYPGGTTALYNDLSTNLSYPEKALKDSIQGTVVIRFVVDKAGKMKDFHVIRSVHKLLDDEALRALRLLNKPWEPGTQNDTLVNVFFNLPVKFALN